jgi:hypothetical protein
MNKPLKITFDKNVYEYVADPEKALTHPGKEQFKIIHKGIRNGSILPFISETILTYETIGRNNRKEILSNNKPFVFSSSGSVFTMASNPDILPVHHTKDEKYLTAAIALGFKILPGKRIGKLINPAIDSSMYYFTGEDYMVTSERFAEVAKMINSLGAGYSQYHDLVTTEYNKHRPPYEKLKQYTGTAKKLKQAVGEWSDGDSISLHIAYQLDFFCTNDRGKNAGRNAALNPANCKILNDKYGFTAIDPLLLADQILSPVNKFD